MSNSGLTVIYISGYGRSGSSLLSLILGSNAEIFSAGEIANFPYVEGSPSPCSCGKSVDVCDFWSDLYGNAVDGGGKKSYRYSSIPLLYAHKRSGKSLVVDASKTAYGNFIRPWVLAGCGVDVRVIHLVRRLPSVIRSAMKGRNKDLESGSGAPRSMEFLRTSIGWIFANISAGFYGAIHRDRYLLVHYESFVRSPSLVLEEISRFLGVDLSREIAKVDYGRPFCAQHDVAGNRMLRAGSVVIRNDY